MPATLTQANVSVSCVLLNLTVQASQILCFSHVGQFLYLEPEELQPGEAGPTGMSPRPRVGGLEPFIGNGRGSANGEVLFGLGGDLRPWSKKWGVWVRANHLGNLQCQEPTAE